MMRRASALLLCLLSASAFADSSATLSSGRAVERSTNTPEQEISIDLSASESYFQKRRHWSISPPRVEANFKNGMFLSSRDGIGYRFLEDPSGFSMAASLRGTGHEGIRAQANLFLMYDKGPFHASAKLHQALGSMSGTGLDLNASYDLYADSNNLVRASAGVSYLNRKSMNTYFGVDAGRWPNSGLATYAPHSGVAHSDVGITWRHAFNREWVGTFGANVMRLRGPAEDSPLVDRRTNASVQMSIGYRF